jgi:CO dehydrogenase maturation factor
LFVISDPSLRGITTAARVVALIHELKTKVGSHHLIVNRATNGLSPEIETAIAEGGLNLLATVPADEAIAALDAAGKPIVDLDADSPASSAFTTIIESILAQKG